MFKRNLIEIKQNSVVRQFIVKVDGALGPIRSSTTPIRCLGSRGSWPILRGGLIAPVLCRKKWQDYQQMILLCRFGFSDLPENTSVVLTVEVAVTKVNHLNSLSFNLSALHVKIFIQRQLTCRELLDGYRWYWYTLRPIGYLSLGEFSSCRCAPFTLEFFLSNCLFSCSLFLLFNLFTGKTI